MPNAIIKLTPRYKMAHDIYISLLKLGFDEKTIQDFLNNINDADVVEVVRCKDCKYYYHGTCTNDFALNLMRENDYCSYGERRSE